jgi:A/G-specific adenine glycosylase
MPHSSSASPASAFDRGRFADRVIRWQLHSGRHSLPWQATQDAYRIWLSEIMLQQTQVAAALGYYTRFLERFPALSVLAAATLDEVMPFWAGLGYYSRARNLWACAREVETRYGGQFPSDPALLEALPGIGRSTAGAIAALAFGRQAAILDGNVRRVLSRVFGIEGDLTQATVLREVWSLAESLLPRGEGIGPYTQGLMDLGATVCTRSRPRCEACPLASDCIARIEDRVRELPRARRRAVRPTREQHWLILRQASSIWLERRPERGIWGGLWSFPELELGADVNQLICDWGFNPKARQDLPVIEHGFTHFVLRAHPIEIEVEGSQDYADHSDQIAAEGQWLDLAEVASKALPKPVAELLRTFSRSSDRPVR